MLRKIALILALTLGFSVTAPAQEFHYIGVQGSWWNGLYAGEGFSLEEYEDGFIIAYWYTYDPMGNQMWLIGTGTREGNTVVLEMNRTEGGLLADPGNPDSVVEEPWGTVTLSISSCGEMEMSYENMTGETGGYALSRLLNSPLAGSACNAVEQEPEPEPEPDPPVEEPPPEEEPPPDPEPSVDITLQKWNATGEWIDIEIPFSGHTVINNSWVGNVSRVPVMQLRILVNKGDLKITQVTASEASGISSPGFTGIKTGQTYQEGSIVSFTLDSNLTRSVTVHPNYKVFGHELGEILNLTIALTTTHPND